MSKKPAAIGRVEFFQECGLKREPIDLTIGDKTLKLFIKVLNGPERAKLEEATVALTKKPDGGLHIAALVVVATLVDADGNRFFQDEDVAKLVYDTNTKYWLPVAIASRKLSGLYADDVEKKSGS